MLWELKHVCYLEVVFLKWQDNCDKSTSGLKYQKHNLVASSTADKEDYSSLFNEHLKDNGARLKADKLYCDSLSCY